MNDEECRLFLQWALPQIHLRWPGFRKVRGQVCKRIRRRFDELGLSGAQSYRRYVVDNPSEWSVVDKLCLVTISRFYRDVNVFDFVGQVLLPQLAENAAHHGESTLRAWSIGCGCGEEPYTVALIWRFRRVAQPQRLGLQILATDVNEETLARPAIGCYPRSSLDTLPHGWIDQAFKRVGDQHCLHSDYRKDIEFSLQDIRTALPEGRFHLILCRNLLFTYFDDSLQRTLLARILTTLLPEGALIIGKSEELPDGFPLTEQSPGLRIFRRFHESATLRGAQ